MDRHLRGNAVGGAPTGQRGYETDLSAERKNLPEGAKKPDALTTMAGERPVIVVMNARKSPSWIAFIVAHELGHIHHKHLKAGQTLRPLWMRRSTRRLTRKTRARRVTLLPCC